MSTRRPMVAPVLQVAAYAQTPVHADPSVTISGRIVQPVVSAGRPVDQPSAPYKPALLQLPTIVMGPQPRLADQGSTYSVVRRFPVGAEGMPLSSWGMRRNLRAVPPVTAGETTV